MRLARDLPTRIFFMDQGGIYEDGTPDQIFSNPQKERTRNFIYRIRSWEYSVSAWADIYEMMGSLEDFCRRQFMGSKASTRCQLAVEELTSSVLLPALQNNHTVTVDLRLNAGEEGKEMRLEVDHHLLPDENLFSNSDDDISLSILRSILERQPEKEPGIAVFQIK